MTPPVVKVSVGDFARVYEPGWCAHPHDCPCSRGDTVATANTPGHCDDGEPPWLTAEVSIFKGRGDEWFVLEWWDHGVGWVVSKANPTLYSDDSGPLESEVARAEGR